MGADVWTGADLACMGPEGRVLFNVRVLELAALLPVNRGQGLCVELSLVDVLGASAA